MKKRLLITASTFPRWEGDTEPRFILDLAKALGKYFDVTVLAPAALEAKTEETMEGIKVIRYHYFPIHAWETLCYPGSIVPRIKEKKIRVLLVPFLFISLWWKLLRISKEYDVVQANWLIPQGIVQSFFSKPYLVTGHGSDITSLNNVFIKLFKRKCLKKAKAVTVVSNALKTEAKLICDTCEPNVLSMGCNTRCFGREYRVDNLFGQNNEKVILFVGRLAEVKGVKYLIAAMKQVNAKLVIVGDGTLKAELEKQAEEIKDKVLFMGAKSHNELKSIYASADIFVMPSITTGTGQKEGFGLVLIEAMASGLPVIGSDSGGIPEIIEDGKCGFLVEEKNADDIAMKINYLIENPGVLSSMQSAAVERAGQYDYEVIGKKYADIILKTCL